MTVIQLRNNLNQVNELNNEEFFRCNGEHIESIRNSSNPELPYNPIRFREQVDFIKQTYYSIVGSGQSLIYKMRQTNQELNALKVARKSIYDTVYRRFKGEIEPILLVDNIMLNHVPVVTGERYDPSSRELYITIDHSLYANTYLPPKYKVQNSSNTRPEMWQKYLDRLMPPDKLCWFRENQNHQIKQQDYFNQWIAQRIQQPEIAPEVAIVLRGEQGAGKSFWLDVLLKPLLGDSNYKSVSLTQITDKFKAHLWSTSLIQIEELNDSKNKVSEILKQLITQTIHSVEQKFQDPYQAKKHFGIVITSNEQMPLLIEKNDRRYLITHFSKVDDYSQRFFEHFAYWLESCNGYQEMYDYFHYVDISNFDIRKAPITKEKQELMEMRTPSDQKKDIARTLAFENKDCLFFPTMLSKELQIPNHVAVQSLREAGFETFENKRRYSEIDSIPLQAWKHKNTTNAPNKIWVNQRETIYLKDSIHSF